MWHANEIIYISSIPWEFSWHRQQEMMVYMAEHGFKVLFVEPCCKRYPFQPTIWQARDQLWVMRSQGLPYERLFTAIHWINARISRGAIEKKAGSLQFENPIVWIDRVQGFDFAYFQKKSFVIYDLVDEILAFGRIRNKNLLLGLENRVLKSADILLSSSMTLLERKKAQSGRNGTSVFLPNGVDCQRFVRVEERQRKKTDPLVLGFIGDISKRRLNYRLIEQIARKKKDWKLSFVGPGSENEKKELAALSLNIEVKPAVSGAEIPAVVGAFDIGIIPYNVEKEDMDYIFPRKACEYLAAGKAVVSTPLKEVAGLTPFVKVAVDADQFIECVEESVRDTGITSEQRRTFAQGFDWNNLMKDLIAALLQSDENGR